MKPVQYQMIIYLFCFFGCGNDSENPGRSSDEGTSSGGEEASGGSSITASESGGVFNSSTEQISSGGTSNLTSSTAVKIPCSCAPYVAAAGMSGGGASGAAGSSGIGGSQGPTFEAWSAADHSDAVFGKAYADTTIYPSHRSLAYSWFELQVTPEGLATNYIHLSGIKCMETDHLTLNGYSWSTVYVLNGAVVSGRVWQELYVDDGFLSMNVTQVGVARVCFRRME